MTAFWGCRGLILFVWFFTQSITITRGCEYWYESSSKSNEANSLDRIRSINLNDCLITLLSWMTSATFCLRSSFTNYVDTILVFFGHLPPYIDILYGINVDKKLIFLDHLPSSSCKRSLWTTPSLGVAKARLTFRKLGLFGLKLSW